MVSSGLNTFVFRRIASPLRFMTQPVAFVPSSMVTTMSLILNHHKHEVIQANDGKQGLARCREHRHRIDLLPWTSSFRNWMARR